MEVQLRKTMGGYKRADVQSYIETLVEKYEAQLTLAREEVATAKRETEAALKENAELFQKLSGLLEERDSVSRAVIAAQKEADEILEKAKLEAEALLLEKQKELETEEAAKAALQAEIRSLRLSASASLRKYEAALAELSPAEPKDGEE